jgi:hypothetical protein
MHRIWWNPKVHYCVCKSQWLVNVLCHVSPVHFYFFKNFLISSSHLCLSLPSGLFLQVSPPKPFMHFFLSPMCHVPHPSHPLWFDHSDYISWGMQMLKFLIMQFSPLCSYLYLLGPKIFLSSLFLNTLCSSLSVSNQVPLTYKTRGKILVLCVVIFIFIVVNGKTHHHIVAGIPWFYSALNFFLYVVNLIVLFPNIWTLPHFQKVD